MELIYKCRILRHNKVDRQLVEINSDLGVTSKELREQQKKQGFFVERILINTKEFIYNSFRNKGYEVENVYIPTVKNRFKDINDYYAVDLREKGHLFLGYELKEVKKNISIYPDYY